jgi:hypothetical protein
VAAGGLDIGDGAGEARLTACDQRHGVAVPAEAARHGSTYASGCAGDDDDAFWFGHWAPQVSR